MPNRSLPIYEIEPDLLRAWPSAQRIILTAPTGSGKSTQIPQILLDASRTNPGRLVVVEPRRLAARLLAARVAAERGVRLGEEVGYRVRFDERCSSATRIEFVTDGVLWRQMLADPLLGGVHAILFDEFHERHLFSDVALGRALQLQRGLRPDLRVVVMSATLDIAALERHLAPCVALRAEGRQYPVTIRYRGRMAGGKREADPWDAAAMTVAELFREYPEGDVLVFMPGAYEIHRTLQALRREPTLREADLRPLHGELPPAEQDAAVAPSPRRKVVVATNVAETSITIEGVRLVVDSGLARVARYDPRRGINTLLVERISRAAAEQRAGRAGRTAPGVCVRLWTEREQQDRPAREAPEILRVDLADILLTLRAAGVKDPASFPWLDPPDPRALERAETLLHDLGAIAADGELTDIGRRMAVFPMHPRYARMMLEAERLGCVPAAALAAALTQERNLLSASSSRDAWDGNEPSSDFFRLAAAWAFARDTGYDPAACQARGIRAATARQIERFRRQFLDIARREGLCVDGLAEPDDRLRRCLLAGFADHVACRLDTGTLRCAMVHGRKGVLDRDSAARDAPLLVAAEISEIERADGDLTVRLSLATAIEESWLEEMFPHDMRQQRVVTWDASRRRLEAKEQRQFRDLVLSMRPAAPPTAEETAERLTEEIARGRLTLPHWDSRVEQWIRRVNALAGWCPELGLPTIGPAERRMLVARLCAGASSWREVAQRPVWPVVRSWLPPAQQALVDRHAPEQLVLPNGQKARVEYPADGTAPRIALRIQQLYGVEGPLTIAKGRATICVEVLAPNGRPVQITQDLAGFWRNAYPAVRRELSRKYPKHEWH